MTRASQDRRGFTLLETLAVVGITGFLVASITGMYVAIMNNSERASEATRESRVASAILDRIARDLERAYLLAWDEEDDPLSHPWVFVSNNRTGQLGSDQVMFTTISHDESGRQAESASNSGLATYTYWLEANEFEGYDLLRLIHPRLPEDHVFPRGDEPGTMLVAEELGSFSLRFMDEGGAWLDTWDSSTLLDLEQMPLAVEISLGFLPPIEATPDDLLEEPAPLTEYRRRVVLYQRALTEAVALGLGLNGLGGADGKQERKIFFDAKGGCPSGVSWDACLDRQNPAAIQALDAEKQQWLNARRGECVPEVTFHVPGLDMTRCQ